MKQTIDNAEYNKSKWLIFLEYFLFACCLCIIALRTTIAEGAKVQTSFFQFNISDNYHSLIISAVLLVCLAVWTIIWFFGRFRYKFTFMETGLVIFIFAAALSFYAASNKRSAITDISLLISPILMAIMLIQILDKQKIYILLAVIASLGAISSYKCVNQYLTESKYLVEQYEKDQQSILKPLGIEPNSFNHMLFEHRVYSKDINGYFTTGNSAGSFSILALFSAIAILSQRPKNKNIYGIAIIVFFVLAGLLITHSKGANGAALILLCCFGFYYWKTDLIRKYKWPIAISSIILFVGICVGVVYYGIEYGKLPGGKSMLIRWEYWQAAAKMIKEHFWTGIGAGNFATYYFHYKLPQGIETISDPHNFILRILTEYGIIGCFGFLLIILVPMLNYVFSSKITQQPKIDEHIISQKPATAISIIVAFAILLIRPLILLLPKTTNFADNIYVLITIIAAPAAVFLIAYWIIFKDAKENNLSDSNSDIISAAIFCGMCGVLLHGMVDFAFYEAGVYTTFWALFACVVVLNKKQNAPGSNNIAFKTIFATLTLAAVIGFFIYSLIPCQKTTALIQEAVSSSSSAGDLLKEAEELDRFDPKISSLNASMLIQQYSASADKNNNLLLESKKHIELAIKRDPADFKNYESLMDIYLLMGQFKEAFEAAKQAVERYPNSDRLRFSLAMLAEKNKHKDIAIVEYEKTIEIEDSYRKEYQMMYPGKKMFSRLGEEKYETAKERLKVLKQETQK